MTRLGLGAVLALVLVAAMTGSAPTGGRLWVLGDSIGVGVSAQLRALGVPHESRVEQSTTAQQWLARGHDVLAELAPGDVVSVSLGTNDYQSASLLAGFAGAMAQLRAGVESRGARFVWLAPPSPSIDDWRFRFGTPYEIAGKSLPMADRWHPTVEGYRMLAEAVRRLGGY